MWWLEQTCLVFAQLDGNIYMIYQLNDELLKSSTNKSDSLNEMIVSLDNFFSDYENTAKLSQFSNSKRIIIIHQKPH